MKRRKKIGLASLMDVLQMAPSLLVERTFSKIKNPRFLSFSACPNLAEIARVNVPLIKSGFPGVVESFRV
jgi:hypothetical protein